MVQWLCDALEGMRLSLETGDAAPMAITVAVLVAIGTVIGYLARGDANRAAREDFEARINKCDICWDSRDREMEP